MRPTILPPRRQRANPLFSLNIHRTSAISIWHVHSIYGGVRPAVQPPASPAPPALVLLVDDGPDATGLYREYLEFCGFRVMIAGSLHAVLDAQANVPNIIVIDLASPRVDASETIRQLKAHPRTTHIPLVALSGAAPDETLRARAAGADVCLEKPCVPSQVARAIRALLVWRRARVR